MTTTLPPVSMIPPIRSPHRAEQPVKLPHDLDLTRNVPTSAALRTTAPPVVRHCKVCEQKLPAGIVRHPQCRGWKV